MPTRARLTRDEQVEAEGERDTATFDAHPGVSKRELTAEMREARSFIAGAVLLLRDDELRVCDTALEMADEALDRARHYLALRAAKLGDDDAGELEARELEREIVKVPDAGD